MFNFLSENNIISRNQSGFLLKYSTTFQLMNIYMNIYNTIVKHLDKGKEARMLFCDISKAFDRVWHDGLIYKLKKYGISGNMIEWFSSCLNGRMQRVVVDGF